MDDLIVWQRVEGALVLVAAMAIYVVSYNDFQWWVALLVFFAPDASFGAYLLGPKAGAFGYNFMHVYAFGAMLLAVGTTVDWMTVSALGALWLAHSGFDRMLGYGLKSRSGFKNTHLGTIGGATPG